MTTEKMKLTIHGMPGWRMHQSGFDPNKGVDLEEIVRNFVWKERPMTNFEKNKDALIALLVASPDTCRMVWQMRTGKNTLDCPSANDEANLNACAKCEEASRAWLNCEVGKIDWANLESGTRFKMTRKGHPVGDVYSFIHYDKGWVWSKWEGNVPGIRDDAVMSVKQIEDEFENFEVIG